MDNEHQTTKTKAREDCQEGRSTRERQSPPTLLETILRRNSPQTQTHRHPRPIPQQHHRLAALLSLCGWHRLPQERFPFGSVRSSGGDCDGCSSSSADWGGLPQQHQLAKGFLVVFGWAFGALRSDRELPGLIYAIVRILECKFLIVQILCILCIIFCCVELV